MKTLHVAPSPISNRIFAGAVLKDCCTWGANKTDVTEEACAAVAKHTLSRGGALIIGCNGKPKYEITVLEIKESDQQKGVEHG